MSGFIREKSYLVPWVILGLGAMTVASAQTSNSPFASKVKKKAWETTAPVTPHPAPAQYPPSQYSGPLRSPTGQRPATLDYTQQAPSSVPQSDYTPNAGVYNYQAPSAVPSYVLPTSSKPQYNYAPQSTVPSQSGAYYPGRAQPSYSSNPGSPYSQEDYGQQPYNQPYREGRASQDPRSGYGGPQTRPQRQYAKRSWADRLGLRNWKTALSGAFRGGVAATNRDDWDVDFVGNGHVELEASTITQGGLEYGINLEARAQYDKFRRGFGGLVGDCPPTIAGCPSITIDGTPTALRGHTSQFYSSGPDNAKETEIALEGAYLFLRSAYGDVTIGRDDGAAYLFSLGAPTLLAVNASNSPVDYTGLDSVKTVNDASGFAEKVTYTSPRLLGDQIGIGVQFGASYAPNARACGVDYCVRRNGVDVSGTVSPDLEDVFEVGVALDRKFDNGLGIEATATYARASEESGLAVFDDLNAYNAGVEVTLADWTVGGSWLKSNNGLANGDYEAWDAGITWKPSALGFTVGYGHATDDNVNLTSDQIVAGVSYEFDRFTVGTGVQYIERTVSQVTGLDVGETTEDATSIFVEAGFKF